MEITEPKEISDASEKLASLVLTKLESIVNDINTNIATVKRDSAELSRNFQDLKIEFNNVWPKVQKELKVCKTTIQKIKKENLELKKQIGELQENSTSLSHAFLG